MFLYKLKALMKDSLSVSEASLSEGDTFIPQIVINPSQTEQLGVSPHLHHLSSLQHKDPVGVHDGGQTMSDGDGCSPYLGRLQGLLHDLLALGVQS